MRIETIGNAVLYNADCRDVLPALSTVDAVVTDPPYGIDGGSGGDAKDFGKGAYTGAFPDTPDYIAATCVPVIAECVARFPAVAVTPGTRCLFLYPAPRDMGCFWTPAGATHGPWGMVTFNPILYYGKDWRAGRGALPSGRQVTEAAEKNGHPCPKPIKAWTWLVDKVCPPEGTVFDPFMGSGTGAVACHEANRKFIGCELDPMYFDIACERIERVQRQERLFA